MESNNTNRDNHREQMVNDILKEAFDEPVPAGVESRLRSRLTGFRHRCEAENRTVTYPALGLLVRSALGAAAVIALFAGVWVGLTPSLTLADVQAAMEKRPWIHIVFDNGDEFWKSLDGHKSYFKGHDGYMGGGRLQHQYQAALLARKRNHS